MVTTRLRFASLGSGSRGNGTLFEMGGTTILVDCGFSLRQTEARLQRLGKSLQDIDAIVVTHEHGDHLGGVRRAASKGGIPVWMTAGTASEAERRHGLFDSVRIIGGHERFSIDGIEINPFHVLHDASEPVQFTFSNGGCTVGLLTDLGEVTPHIERQLGGCDALLLECNHDPELLAAGSYPIFLQKRVAGRLGHLSNRQAAVLLKKIDTSRLQHLAVMHMSEKNNREELAASSICGALGCEREWISIATQQDGLGWREIV